jgi:hypothetical protein
MTYDYKDSYHNNYKGYQDKDKYTHHDKDKDYHRDHGGRNHRDDDDSTYATLLLPQNNSGVFGAAVVNFDEDDATLTVSIKAMGLTPSVEHPQHIHGFPDGKVSQPPTIEFDTDKDGFVEVPEGSLAIGGHLLDLFEEDGSYPAADKNGFLYYERTFDFDLKNEAQATEFAMLQDFVEGRAVNLHGMNVPEGEGAGTQYEVHGPGGYISALPVAGGILKEVDDKYADWLLS